MANDPNDATAATYILASVCLCTELSLSLLPLSSLIRDLCSSGDRVCVPLHRVCRCAHACMHILAMYVVWRTATCDRTTVRGRYFSDGLRSLACVFHHHARQRRAASVHCRDVRFALASHHESCRCQLGRPSMCSGMARAPPAGSNGVTPLVRRHARGSSLAWGKSVRDDRLKRPSRSGLLARVVGPTW